MKQVLQFSKVLNESGSTLSGVLVLEAKDQLCSQKYSEQITKKKKYEFPRPEDMPTAENAFFCHAKRILEIYSKYHGRKQQRMTAPVQAWFQEEAYRFGWGEAEVLTDVASKNGYAGCMLRLSDKGEISDFYH